MAFFNWLLPWIACALTFSFEPVYHFAYQNASVQQAQQDPNWIGQTTDRFWRSQALWLIERATEEQDRSALRLARALPANERPEEVGPGEIAVIGTYGKLPDIFVDENVGAIFPMPFSAPTRHSWYRVSLLAAESWRTARKLAAVRISKGPAQTPLERAEALLAGRLLEDLQRELLKTTAAARHMKMWEGSLKDEWRAIQARGLQSHPEHLPTHYRLAHVFSRNDTSTWGLLREALKPRRFLKLPYLPDKLSEKNSETITLPIATDVVDTHFRREIEDALDLHWNRSPWARIHRVRFKIRWVTQPAPNFESAKPFSLATHIEGFPREMASMTTGGLTTLVRGKTLVLGPGRVDQRTIGHELGHLLGFNDCYLRTLGSQGVLGLAVLEWDNPLYPDELMCDNTLGVARVGVW